MASIPIVKIIYDRKKVSSANKEGLIELRITLGRVQRYITTGIKVLPKCYRDGCIINRLDARELQESLDMFVAHARRVINQAIEEQRLDIMTIGREITSSMAGEMGANKISRSIVDYIIERARVRKYGKKSDTQERYDRFVRWFSEWGGMVTFEDATDVNVIKMDEALGDKMKEASRWHNYHRFLGSFLADAVDEGLLRRNPYKTAGLGIRKVDGDSSIDKFLTEEQLASVASCMPSTEYLRHARDLFLFQVYSCMAYIDLASFDASKIRMVDEHPMYTARRAKTGQEFCVMLLPQAMEILNEYEGRLPIMSNQKYNQYLKMIAGIVGIDAGLSSHWARHTGATLLLNSGVSMDVVAKILGHSSTRITKQIYAKMLDTTVADEMAKLVKKS